MASAGVRQREDGGRERGSGQRLAWGLAAGVLGTAALALSDQVERLILDRQPIYSHRRIGRRLARRHLPGRSLEQGAFLGVALRWTYGPAWGLVYGLLRPVLPGSELAAALVTSAGIGGLELIVFPLVGATPRVRRWPRAHRGALLLHTSVYALVTALTYSRIASRAPRRSSDQPPP